MYKKQFKSGEGVAKVWVSPIAEPWVKKLAVANAYTFATLPPL